MPRTISIYIMKQLVGPFVFGMFVIVFILLMEQMIKFIDLFLGKGIAFSVVLEVFILSLGWMMALVVPMAVLVAVLMTFGRLAADNEITAMKASGISTFQILAGPVFLSLLLAFLLVQFNNRVLPDSNHRLAGLLGDIHRKRPALAIKAGAFTDIQGYTIRVESLNETTSELQSVTIQKKERNEESETIVAKRGRLAFTDNGNVLNLYLEDGEIHGVDETNPNRYHRMLFHTHTIRIDGIGTELVRSDRKNRGDRELSAADMMERVDSYREEIVRTKADQRQAASEAINDRFAVLASEPDTAVQPADIQRQRIYAREVSSLGTELISRDRRVKDKQRQADKYLVEVHKKYSLPVACIVFVLVGTPLGVRARRGGLGVGVGFSIVFFVIYYLFLTGGEKLADRGYVTPAVSMWAANVIMGLLGLYLINQSDRDSSRFSFLRFLRKKRKKSTGGTA